MADILLLEDDEKYVEAVRDHFANANDKSLLTLHPARDISAALAICRKQDVRVAIIDLSLPNGSLGTDAISEIYKFDKKIIFIIHTVHDPQATAGWCASVGVPYASQFFLQKTGRPGSSGPTDAYALYELSAKALRSYVPYFPPAIISVREVIEIMDVFSCDHRAFRRTAIASNIHRSQDALNSASQWAADRLARTGYDSTRIGVAMTGSFARLEAAAVSDADYFVVFDDIGLSPRHLSDVINLAYHSFLAVGDWFESYGIPVHNHLDERKQPDKIEWHRTTLPTWFPLSSLLKAKLGRDTQLELTKQWFLLESCHIFNAPLLHDIRLRIAEQMGVFAQPTIRGGVTHSSLPESFQMLKDEFEYAFRSRTRDSLTIVKHYFMRLLNLFSIQLWLLRCVLDPIIFEKPSASLFDELLPHPLARVFQFHHFLLKGTVLQGKSLKESLFDLEVICNSYGEAAQSFGSSAIREPTPSTVDNLLINDLAEAGQRCQDSMCRVLRTLAQAPSTAAHPEIARRRILGG